MVIIKMLQAKQKSLDFIDFLRERRRTINQSKSIVLTVNQGILDQYKSIQVSKKLSKSRIQHKFTLQKNASRFDKSSMRKTRKWQSILGHYIQAQEKIHKLKSTKSQDRYLFYQQDKKYNKMSAYKSFKNVKEERKFQLQLNSCSNGETKFTNQQSFNTDKLPQQGNLLQNLKIAINQLTISKKISDRNQQKLISSRLVNFVEKYFQKKFKPRKYRNYSLSGRQQQNLMQSLILKP